jgi:phosphatidylinositol alpha-1,6-mannosyltransferase
MRVLLVATEFPPGPGGVGTHAWELARHLSGRGWSLTVLASQDYVTVAEADAFNAAQPFRVVPWRRAPLGPLRFLARLAGLKAILRTEAPDAVVASGGRAVLACAHACAGRGTPWLAVGHGTEFGARGLKRLGFRTAFRRATAVVAVSEFTRRLFLELAGADRDAGVIHNGADPERFRVLPAGEAALRLAPLGIPPGRLLLTVGNVTSRKGQDVVVRALPQILRAIPDARYVVAGLPTEGERLKRLARECGVADRVHLTGRLDAETLTAALNIAELFLLTSRRTAVGDVEGYGIAVVEAALCGRPAVVSRGSGLEEAIVEGETGPAVPADDPDATAAAAAALLTDPARLRRMGERARERALAEQTWDRCVDRYAAELESIAGGARGRPVRRAAAP